MSDATPTIDAPSKPPLRFRRTRIGVSVFFGVLTLVLCVLWARSYYVADHFGWVHDQRGDALGLDHGSFRLWGGKILMGTPVPGWIYVQNMPSLDAPAFAWGWVPNDSCYEVFASVLPFAAGSACCAFAPFLTLSFSLRTMLIATTLVAAVLGLGVWLDR